MKFWKMNGAGNDFIIINNIEEKIPVSSFPSIAKTLCKRKLSIGADGLMVVLPAENGADFRMLFLNSDGSIGEMCGNGARCICRYGYENGLSGDVQHIETTAGPVTGERLDNRNYRVKLNDATLIKLNTSAVTGTSYVNCDYIELGTPGLPHVVVSCRDIGIKLSEKDLASIAPELRNSVSFQKGANVNFYEIISDNEINEITYERGVEDFTLACGTGTGCVVSALTLKGLVSGEKVRVNCPGGILKVTVSTDGDEVKSILLTGPTNIVAKGEIYDEDLVY